MAADVRSFWKGHLRLALVTIPIRLVSATAPEGTVRLHQVDRISKQRIRYQKVAAESGEVVDSSDIVRGVEVEPGRYVLMSDDELDALKLSTRHTLDLTSFVHADDVDPVYYDRPYYVLPDGEIAEEGYRVIADALRQSGMIGIGQLTMRGREHLVALSANDQGLVLETLRYAKELKDPARVFAGLGEGGALRPELTEMAVKLIQERTRRFDPAAYRDHYNEALNELVRAKVEGSGAIEVSGGGPSAPTGNVVDFMEALRRSVAGEGQVQEKGRSGKTQRAVATTARRGSTRREKADVPPQKPKKSSRSGRRSS